MGGRYQGVFSTNKKQNKKVRLQLLYILLIFLKRKPKKLLFFATEQEGRFRDLKLLFIFPHFSVISHLRVLLLHQLLLLFIVKSYFCMTKVFFPQIRQPWIFSITTFIWKVTSQVLISTREKWEFRAKHSIQVLLLLFTRFFPNQKWECVHSIWKLSVNLIFETTVNIQNEKKRKQHLNGMLCHGSSALTSSSFLLEIQISGKKRELHGFPVFHRISDTQSGNAKIRLVTPILASIYQRLNL